MPKYTTKNLTPADIDRLQQFGRATPNATRRQFAALLGMSYNTLLRLLAEHGLRFARYDNKQLLVDRAEPLTADATDEPNTPIP